MNRELDRLVQNITSRLDKVNVLEISGNRWKVEGETVKYTQASYPEFDICQNVLPGDFNLIIAEMVFEHLPYPYRAGRNVFQMLNTPGFFVISTPFMYPVHNHPIDCTRWTRAGMKYFLTECGFDENRIHTDSWGNRDCVKAMTPGPVEYDEQQHSLENDPDYPVSVWAIANK